MAAVEVTISGVLFDKLNRTSQQVVLVGEASLSGVGIGGGPIMPGRPEYPGAHPEHPIFYPPGIWGPPGPWPTPPIYLPPIPVPPQTPNLPPPGSPPVIVGGTQPTNPIVPPPAVIIEYPGVGKVVVPQPVAAAPTPEPAQRR